MDMIRQQRAMQVAHQQQLQQVIAFSVASTPVVPLVVPHVAPPPGLPDPCLPVAEIEVPLEVTKQLKDLVSSYRKNIVRRLRVTKYIQEKQTLAIFNDPEGYPKGVRTYKSPKDFIRLGNPSPASTEDHLFTIVLPRGASRRDACELVHRHNQCFCAAAELEAPQAHLAALEGCASKQLFFDRVGECKPAIVPSLGLEDATAPCIYDSVLAVQAQEIYQHVIDAVRKAAAMQTDKQQATIFEA
jgi:hypothetical protein